MRLSYKVTTAINSTFATACGGNRFIYYKLQKEVSKRLLAEQAYKTTKEYAEKL